MKKLSLVFLLSFLFLLTLNAQTQASPVEGGFTEAIQAYQAKDFKKAQQLLSDLLKQEPENPIVLTNLALAEYQLGQKYLALGYIRKALSIDPQLKAAQSAQSFLISQVPASTTQDKANLYENFRSLFLAPVTATTYFLISILCLFVSGWLLISYIGRRKKASAPDSLPPAFPWVGALIGVLFLCSSILLLLKLYDQTQVRGTILLEQVPLQTAPGENQVSIQNVLGGEEVLLLNESKDWVQIRPLNKPAGWIKKSAILMTR